MAAWTVTELLADVRKLGGLPSNAALGLADSDLVAHADVAMAASIVPHVMSMTEEFYVALFDYTLVSGQAAYRLPPRSIGGRLRDVQIVYGSIINPLPRLEPTDTNGFVANQTGLPFGFYARSGSVILLPAASVSGTLRLSYFVQPGRFITTAAGTGYGVITGVTYSTSSVVITYSAASNLFTAVPTVDVISARPPYEHLAVDGVKTASGIGTVTINNVNVSPQIAVGDLVTFAEQSPIVQAPNEAFSLLSHETALRVAESLKHSERIDILTEKIDKLRKSASTVMTPRVDGKPQKIMGVLQNLGRRW